MIGCVFFVQVEGVVVESDRTGKVLDLEEGHGYCPLCPHKLNTTVKYTVRMPTLPFYLFDFSINNYGHNYRELTR